MKRSLLVILTLLVGILPTLSQEVVRLNFVIKDSGDQHPLTSVSCRVVTPEEKIRTFGISDKDGKVAMSADRADTIIFSLIGYETVRACATEFTAQKSNTVLLAEKAYEIREVAIKAQPITSKNDTITYLAKAFTHQGDAHLEDILNNLPGVKVSENGYISYQGKSINKFYIEGKDLLGSNYNQATRNMPAEAIAAIEILENHQPTKMLRGKQHSDKAAINIKIDKNYKSRLFGEVEAGIGDSPTIWDNRVFITRVGQKNQMLFTGKMNNVGNDLSAEMSEHVDITDIDAYEPIPSGLLSTSTQSESIEQNRYLRNKSYSGGLNYLTSFSEDATLRLNILTYLDHTRYENFTKTVFGGAQKVELSQQKILPVKEVSIQPILKYELNGSNMFVSDELKFSVNNFTSAGSISNNRAMVEQTQKNRPTYVQNYYSMSFPIGKQYMQIKSHLRYFDRSESLDATSDTITFDHITERYSSRSLSAKSVVATSLPLWGNSLRLTLRHTLRNSDYDYEGEVSAMQLRLKFSPTYIIRFGYNSILSIALPLTVVNASNTSHKEKVASRDKIGFEPELSLTHNFSDKWRTYLTASHSNDVYAPQFVSPLALRTSYRTSYYSDFHDLFMVEHNRVNLNIGYRNLASLLFANINAGYTDDRNESYVDYSHTEALTLAKMMKGENHRRSYLLNASLDKSIPDLGVSIKSSVDYSHSTYLLSQSGVFTTNNSNVTSANINLGYQKLKWLRLNAGVRGSVCWEDNKVADSDKLRRLDINSSIYVFPRKTIEIKISANNQINEIAKSQFKNFSLFDAEFKYDFNKFLQFSLNATNLSDSQHYIIAQDSGIDSYYYDLPLRGREVLVKVLIRL